RLRITAQDPLADGPYAWAIYGTSSERSGPGNGLYFSHNIAYLDTEAFKTLGDEFTLEAWTRFDDWSYYGSHTYGAAFDVGQSGRHVPGFWLSHVRDEVHFGFRLIDGTTANTIALEAVSKGEWRHLAGVSSAQGMTIYVNGAPATWMPDHFRPDSFADYIDTALVGYSRWAGAYDYVLGMFDEMRVWNVARTQEQIAAAMHTPLVGNEPGLLVYHPLDETTGDVLIDVTGNGYDGDRNGTPRQPSGAPLIEMSSIALLGADGIPVDVSGDSVPGGILVSTFIVDTTPPRVVSIDPDLIECDTVVAIPTLTIGFDDEMDAATLLAANADLIRSGGDGTFDDGNEVQIALTDPQYDAVGGAATFSLGPSIPDDTYRFRLMDQVQSITGAALDGEFPGLGGPAEPLPSGDGAPGGEFVIGFIVDSTQDCNGNGATDACEIVEEGPAVPPLGAIRNPTNGHYYFLAPAMTWAEAEALAVSLGGHLATIRNEVENQWLTDAFLALTSAERVLIGFSDLDVEGVWVWTSGEPVTYTNWAPGQPDDNSNEDIGELVLRAGSCCGVGTWNDRESYTVQPGIIEVVTTNDCNDNGALDECEIADKTSDDCNANGIPDECEPQEDCNANGVQDICDVGSGASRDCNKNGVPDECDIADGVGEDVNGNGMLDECELVVDRVKPCGRFFLFPSSPFPSDVDDAIHVFDRSGSPKGVILNGQIHTAAGVAFDRRGNLIIAQSLQDKLIVVSRDGQLKQTISGGGLDGSRGPAIDGKGGLAVGSYFTDSVKFFDLDGTYLGDLRHSGTEDPHGVAYDRSGNLFVASRNNGNGRVAVFDSEHNFV
ncbi:MAG: hypothetical protein JSU86_07280, partial [Phycisphaerales bacterium]